MGSAYSNYAKRVLSTSKSGHAQKSKNLPLHEYMSLPKTKAQDKITPLQLLHATQSMDITATPLHSIPLP